MWIDTNRLSIIWKSDFSYKVKRDFFQTVAVSAVLYRCTTLIQTKRMEKKYMETTQESYVLF